MITFSPQVVFAPSNVLTLEIGGRTPGPGTPADNGYGKLVPTHAGAPQITWSGALVIEENAAENFCNGRHEMPNHPLNSHRL